MILKKGACLLFAAFAVACSQEQEPKQNNNTSTKDFSLSLSGSIATETEVSRAITLGKSNANWSPSFDWVPELGEVGVHTFIWTDDVADNFPVYTNAIGMGQGSADLYRNKIENIKYENRTLNLKWSDNNLKNRLKDQKLSKERSYNARVVIGGVAGANADEILFTKAAGTAPNPDKLVLIKPNSSEALPRQKRHIPFVSNDQTLTISDSEDKLSQSGFNFKPQGMLLAIKPVLSEYAKDPSIIVDGKPAYPKYVLKAVNIINNSGLYWEATYNKASNSLQGVNGPNNNLRIELYTDEAMTQHPVLDAENPNNDLGYFYVWAYNPNASAISPTFHIEFEIEELPDLIDDDGIYHTPITPNPNIIKPGQNVFRLDNGLVHRLNVPVYVEYIGVD